MLKSAILLLIRIYQRCISPLFPPCCRYYPSCSAYMFTAVRRYGAGKGVWMGLRRILRCHPWAEGGVDFVPPVRIDYRKIRKNHRHLH